MVDKIEDFEGLVDNWVLDAIRKERIEFDKLLTSLPGVYPSILLASLKRLESKEIIPGDLLSNVLIQISKADVQQEKQFKNTIKLPVPHPLDFEWRFAESANKYLLSICMELTQSIDKIALLSTPSLFQTVIEQKYRREVIFVGYNTVVTDELAQVEHRYQIFYCNFISEIKPSVSASIVILDPPWYEDFIYPFLWHAIQICKLNGYILISLPANGTRLGVEQEWQNILKWTKKLGLSLFRKENCILPYTSPFFEYNALRAEGIYNYPLEWRKGNLVIFKKDNQTEILKPQIAQNNIWEEVFLNNVRIRVKRDTQMCFNDPSLITVEPDDILPSVSRKDPRRALAEVWTSGNRIFKCKGRK